MTQPAIEIRNLDKRYGKVHALRSVSVTVPAGPVGLLGPNGAGKTTMLKLLLGMLAPSGGEAKIAGLNPTSRKERLAIRQKVGYMPESDCLIPGMSAVELVALLGRLSGMPAPDAMTRAHEVLDYVGTGEERYRKNEEYSTGMKQRIKLAQALVHDPPILLLDEPTNGLDPKGRKFLLDLVADLGRKQGKHVLLCTHLLPDVERTCDHVIVMNQGSVIEQGSIANLTETTANVVHVAIQATSEESRTQFIARVREHGHKVQGVAGNTLHLLFDQDEVPMDGFFELARSTGVVLTHIVPQRSTLEDAFLKALEQDNNGTMPVTTGEAIV
ncbi:MAG: ABC transporter ATP-binding protein [Planctomycetota bacterium]|nr:ABC transporter ATP-binding protein [Planctomycetota bacterium]